MGTFLDDLRSARKSVSSIYLRFLHQYKQNTTDIHAFFEGHEDLSFYPSFLHKFVSSRPIYLYECGKKKEVYHTYQMIEKNGYLSRRALFFVDKDFSDILAEGYAISENIYITDYYSTENYLVCKEMLHVIWHEFFHFHTGDGIIDLQPFEENFRVQLEHFYDYMLPITAWIIYMRRNKQILNLDEIKLSKLFKLNNDLILERINEVMDDNELFNVLAQMCKVSTLQEPLTVIIQIKEELSNLEPKSHVRGKFELWFFVQFIKKLGELLKGNISQVNGRITIKHEISMGNAYMLLGPRLRSWPSLEAFLMKNLSENTAKTTSTQEQNQGIQISS